MSFRLLAILGLLLVIMAGCGRKPEAVSAPPGSADPDPFPRVYPPPDVEEPPP